ncbi:MAG: hypothetical protein COA43_15200 [Robiginitomaculum sp.]|nr:MAG: hypothetical protein COA43_15200 [Robiginitomaculum sp.]
MKFSERFGYKKVREVFQLNSMDDPLRNGLWNCIRKFVEPNDNFIEMFWVLHLKQTADTCPSHGVNVLGDYLGHDLKRAVRNPYFSSEWHEIYDILELTCAFLKRLNQEQQFQENCNYIMKTEMSAYRFVNGTITPITDGEEVKTIETATNKSKPSVRKHLHRSLELLSDRQNPDYRNSIKESISAVESKVQLLLNDEKGTLGNLLNKLDGLHPSQKEAFKKIYGYTSDKGGIRHALLDEDKIDFDDAKYMLVVCSAFVNYLTGKIQ